MDRINSETEPKNQKHKIHGVFPHLKFKNSVASLHSDVIRKCQTNRTLLLRIVKVFLAACYCVYVGCAFYYSFGDEGSWRLVGLTTCLILIVLFPYTRKLCSKPVTRCLQSLYDRQNTRLGSTCTNILKWSVRLLAVGIFISITAIDASKDSLKILIPVSGMALYIFILFVTSINPAKVKWSIVFWGMAMQYFLALLILRTRGGYVIFKWLGDRISDFFRHSRASSVYIFDEEYTDHAFAMGVLPMIVFFCSAINVLYYLGVMQVLFKGIGAFLAFCLGTTPAESVSAGANVFLAYYEACLVVRPFLASMTKSELHAIITCGYATMTSALFAVYIDFGIPGNHILAASVMSAPASLAVSKLSYPETRKVKSSSHGFDNLFEKSRDSHLIEAINTGATQSIAVVASVLCNYIAFLGLLAFVNATLVWFGARVGIEGLTFQVTCSYVFYPISFFLGVDIADCRKVAELIGTRLFTNEFIAYAELGELVQNRKLFDNYTRYYNTSSWYRQNDDIHLDVTGEVLRGGVITDKSVVIATYALCGFAHCGSLGAFIGGLGSLIPSRQSDLAKLVVRGLVCGNVACFVTACTAALLYQE